MYYNVNTVWLTSYRKCPQNYKEWEQKLPQRDVISVVAQNKLALRAGSVGMLDYDVQALDRKLVYSFWDILMHGIIRRAVLSNSSHCYKFPKFDKFTNISKNILLVWEENSILKSLPQWICLTSWIFPYLSASLF